MTRRHRYRIHRREDARAGRPQEGAGNRHGFAGFLFTAPFMVLFLALFIAPLAYALYLSLFREQLVGGNSFVGLDNYTDGLKDKQFTDGVKRVALFMVVQVPVMLILALVFALIIDSGKVWFGKLYRVGFFVPYAVPTVIAALMWGFLYGRDFGPFADLADAIGVRRRTSWARARCCSRSPTSRRGRTRATT